MFVRLPIGISPDAALHRQGDVLQRLMVMIAVLLGDFNQYSSGFHYLKTKIQIITQKLEH